MYQCQGIESISLVYTGCGHNDEMFAGGGGTVGKNKGFSDKLFFTISSLCISCSSD